MSKLLGSRDSKLPVAILPLFNLSSIGLFIAFNANIDNRRFNVVVYAYFLSFCYDSFILLVSLPMLYIYQLLYLL